jgi:cytochrome c oxidase assembly protein subunit 11
MSPQMSDRKRTDARNAGAALARRHARVALACGVFVASMVGMAYAAVPLYDWFCRTTGFGGTPLIASVAPAKAYDRTIRVTFDANVAAGLAWSFAPETRSVDVKIGETKLVHYLARNDWAEASAGTATYNVSPPQAGAYFNKMQCFCFTEQTLAAGERLEMPVAFFIDPAIMQDPELRTLREITLSYTFFPVKTAAGPQARAEVAGNGRM